MLWNGCQCYSSIRCWCTTMRYFRAWSYNLWFGGAQHSTFLSVHWSSWNYRETHFIYCMMAGIGCGRTITSFQENLHVPSPHSKFVRSSRSDLVDFIDFFWKRDLPAVQHYRWTTISFERAVKHISFSYFQSEWWLTQTRRIRWRRRERRTAHRQSCLWSLKYWFLLN